MKYAKGSCPAKTQSLGAQGFTIPQGLRNPGLSVEHSKQMSLGRKAETQRRRGSSDPSSAPLLRWVTLGKMGDLSEPHLHPLCTMG